MKKFKAGKVSRLLIGYDDFVVENGVIIVSDDKYRQHMDVFKRLKFEPYVEPPKPQFAKKVKKEEIKDA